MQRYFITTAYYRYPFEDRVIRRFALPFLTFGSLELAYEWIMRTMEKQPPYRVAHRWYEVAPIPTHDNA